MADGPMIVELRRRSDVGIFAVPYRGRQRYRTLELLDGVIVETPTPDQRREAPDHLDVSFGVAVDGRPATIHHVNLGLIATFVALEGVYLLPSGDVAAVYGAQAVPIGLPLIDHSGEFLSTDD